MRVHNNLRRRYNDPEPDIDIQRIIHLSGLTIKDFCEKHKIPPGTMNNWLRGYSMPSKKNIEKLNQIYQDLV